MEAKGITGASHGRVGGRLSGGSRLRKALNSAPRVLIASQAAQPTSSSIGGGTSYSHSTKLHLARNSPPTSVLATLMRQTAEMAARQALSSFQSHSSTI